MRYPPLPPRLGDPHGRTRGIDRRLVVLVEHASRYLPEGWRLEVAAGLCPEVLASGLAIKVQLINPAGRRLASKTGSERSAVWRSYRQLADLVFHAQRLVYPDLRGRLAWGGKIALVSGEWDVTHFDLGGWRGRGAYRPPAEDAAPVIMVAELGGYDRPPAA